ncbi:hypothetical protein PHYBOEH_001732 [Phytophthora boehmeriae]|uniref:Homologous recombination OB-fold protein OB-fold domain-containing protein n=1 Tax=Phytophthora boehmeriae TaxID=109152 RepID=A0A8T1X6B9_9STRA|nr:hypothetical protein PHYBOEH_001732 [Phytophthora boehmeriae]
MSASEDDEELPFDGHTGAQSKSLGGKRRRHVDEEDLGSQQSIMEWMRHVPGPLQDVMKKRADQMDTSLGSQNAVASANSDRLTVMPPTVFDQGPWVDMCQYLGMRVTPGTSYGGVKISSLKCPLRTIVEDDQVVTKLLVLIKSMRYVDEEIVAVFHDPTGEIEGYFHRELVEQIGPGIVVGTAVLLYKVSIFTPTEAPVTGRRKSYLNITPRNVRRVFVTKDLSSSAPSDSTVELFNAEKEAEAGQESDNDDYDDKMASTSEQAARQLLQHRHVRDTSAELTFLSQRQVIHRNPPVRVDPATNNTGAKKKGKRGKGAATNAEQEGLGRWQWSKLLKKKTDDNEDESAEGSSRSQGRQGFLEASSRLVSLISKQNSRTRQDEPNGSAGNTKSPSPSTKPKKTPSVRFAPGTAFDPSPSPRNSDNRDVTEMTPTSPASTRHDVATTSPAPVSRKSFSVGDNISDEDDDEDW